MDFKYDSSTTDLYLVRIWRGRPGTGLPGLHGKVQHVVSGVSCEFEGLAALPGAMERMLQESGNSTEDADDSLPL